MEYVDLGLPSGTKWATCNIGAATPSRAGIDYLREEATFVAKQCGGYLPTKADFGELVDYCHWLEIDKDGMKGFCVVGHNGNSIYLAATHGGTGDVWLSDLYPNGTDDTESFWAIYVEENEEHAKWLPMADNEKCAIRLVLK